MNYMYVILLFVLLAVTLYAVRNNYVQRRKLRELTEQLEHFLQYPDCPLSETLEEGILANLGNQISRLEQQFLHQTLLSNRREKQVTRFVENMAHQMNNAVTALQIQLDLLRLRTLPEESAALEKTQLCMERLAAEIDRILKSSQLAAGKICMNFESLEAGEILESCISRLQAFAASRGVTVHYERGKKMNLSGDCFWLSQALENIIKNAVEHTKEGSTVAVFLYDETRFVRIRVEDEGDGIPSQMQGELFERFGRRSETKTGYGIGLSMAKDIIDAHHGTLTAGNRVGQGAWFEILLPVLEGEKPYLS